MVKIGYSKHKRSDGLWMGWAWESPAGKRHYLYDRDRTALRVRIEELASKMRLGECMGLKGEAVDLQNGTITVNLSAVGVSSHVDIKPPKTASSVRKIAMPKIVQDAITPFVHDGFLFTRKGSPWNGGNYTRRFRTHLRLNNLPPTRFHDLRHFSATALMAAGLSDKQISSFLGHSDTNITHRYQHILDNIQSRPAEIFDDLMKK